MFLSLQTEEEVEKGEGLSDDELPPDVDLSDPFFAEELTGGGNHMSRLMVLVFFFVFFISSVALTLNFPCWNPDELLHPGCSQPERK